MVFRPTDEEIIRLLEQKRLDPDFSVHTISEINIYDFEPSELPGLSRIQSDEKWCSFFSQPDYINADTNRVSRATKTGYWKLTGKGCKIKAKHSKAVIGSKRILVFYERPGGSVEIRTDWVMHQFSIGENPLYKKDFVVCRIKRKRDKKRRVSTNVEGQQNKKPCISTRNEGEPSHRIAFDNGNPVEDNTRNCVAEGTSPESQCPPSIFSASSHRHHVTESNLQVDPQHLAKSNALNECNGLDCRSFSALQLPINLEQRPSYSSVSGNDHDASNSLFSGTREANYVNPHQCIQNEYPCEDVGDSSLPLDFTSTESLAGICSGVTSEFNSESETLIEWVNGLFA
ncbi:NAC domain-containing protein 89-like isoform X2 [Mangifera indica]|uniref:NAC domain-containing protein 89-like isoform X2 n=1 Tax=Mangifera indica TaxID=29780 RepID=UPI001CFBDF0D|nr:NAC domain-containing protein 89-like isoform X2 [Mangifera indica]